MHHPLAVGTKVRGERPSCNCVNAKQIPINGTISKVITNNSGIWYYMQDANITIKAQWVVEVIQAA